MNFNYTSLDLVIERLNTSKIPGVEWNISELKEWTWEALSKIGVIQEFIELPLEVEIIDGKGEIPSNIHTIHSVLEGDSSYNMSQIKHFEDFTTLTYKLNNGYIFTDFDKGTVVFNAYVFPLDEEGKPLIPDNEYYISAIYSFLRMKLGERLYWQNKIVGQQYQMLQREWEFYCPAAKNSSKMLTEDKAEDFEKKMLKTVPSYYRTKGKMKNDSYINIRR